LGGLDVQRQPPAAGAVCDGGEADLGPVLGEHPPQSAGVVMHPDLSDASSVIARGRLSSPTRIASVRPLGCVLRSRNDGTEPVFF